MNLILHITQREQWEAAKAIGVYRCASLDTEGFIHCSTSAQVIKVANFLFAGQRGLVLLGLDGDRLHSEVRYDRVGDEAFPHVYGPVNLDAVIRVFELEPNEEGTFQLPEALEEVG